MVKKLTEQRQRRNRSRLKQRRRDDINNHEQNLDENGSGQNNMTYSRRGVYLMRGGNGEYDDDLH